MHFVIHDSEEDIFIVDLIATYYSLMRVPKGGEPPPLALLTSLDELGFVLGCDP